MKKTIVLCLFLFSMYKVLMWVEATNGRSDLDRAADQIIIESGKKLAKKHQMRVVAIGGGAADGITSFSVSFQRLGSPLDCTKARFLIVDCADQFLKDINQDPQVRQFLNIYPFPNKGVSVTIFNYTEDGDDVYYPGINVLQIRKGVIEYNTSDPGKKGSYKTEVTETYEEAVAILNAENSLNESEP